MLGLRKADLTNSLAPRPVTPSIRITGDINAAALASLVPPPNTARKAAPGTGTPIIPNNSPACPSVVVGCIGTLRKSLPA